MQGTPPVGWQRLVIIGSSGSGKSTLARQLAQRLGSPYVELDALHWGPQWTPAPAEQFQERVAAALATPHWVIDGGYSSVRQQVWGQAEQVIWLDFPLPLNLWRIITRTLRRIHTNEELWHGNRESLRNTFFKRDSLLVWSLTTHRGRRRRYQHAVADPTVAHLTVVRLRSPRALQRWLATVPQVVAVASE